MNSAWDTESSFTISPRSTTRPLYFWCFCLQFSIFQMTYVHQWCKMNCSARRPCFIDHLFLTFDFCQVPRRKFLQFFQFLVHCCLCCWNFMDWGTRINLWTNFYGVENCFLFLQHGPHDETAQILPYAVNWIHWLQEHTQVMFLLCGCTTPTILLQNFAG